MSGKDILIAILAAATLAAGSVIIDLRGELDEAHAKLAEAHGLMLQTEGLVDQLLDQCRPKPKGESL